MSTKPAALLPADVPRAEELARDEKREKLPAEIRFDKWVYGGISYAAQAITGSALTYWIRNASGRKYYDAMAKWFGPKVLSKITSYKGADAVKAADSWIVISTMVTVGNLFLIPVKLLENRKPQIIRGMTEKDNQRREARGETIAPEEREKQERLLTELDNAPKQTWTSILGGRGFGLGVVYGVNYVMGAKNKRLGKDYNKLGEELLVKTVSRGVDTAGFKAAAKSKTLKAATGIAFYDMFYSMVSASGLYIYSHFLHPHKKNGPSEPSDTPAAGLALPVVSAVSAATDTALSGEGENAKAKMSERVGARPLKQRFLPAGAYMDMAKLTETEPALGL